jgi:hypothetical protein
VPSLCGGLERSFAGPRGRPKVPADLQGAEPGELTADLYGQVKAQLARQGTPIPQNNILGRSRSPRAPLATCNEGCSFLEDCRAGCFELVTGRARITQT